MERTGGTRSGDLTPGAGGAGSDAEPEVSVRVDIEITAVACPRFVDFVVDGTSTAHKSGTVITNVDVKLVAVFAPLGGEGDGAIDEGEGASAEGDGDDEPGSSCARAVAAPADGITLLALLGWVCVGAAGVADVEGVRLTTWSCACRRHG